MPKRFVILDGSSLFFRAFFALPPMNAPTGEFTNAVVGFLNMFLKLVEEQKPDYLALAFDKSRHTFRTELFADYKGTRAKTPPELSAQVPLLKELSAALGLPFLALDGYEADDIIGTLATHAAEKGLDTLVVTGDRDALQLVRDNLTVMLTKKGISDLARYDEAAFEAEYQMPPIRLIDLKGLMGDTSDNIPGVPGVGPKTATKLLVKFGTLENVLAHADEAPGKKLPTSLKTYAEQARLSKELATIHCAVPGIDLAPEHYVLAPDEEKLAAFCARYGLKKLGVRLAELFGSKQAEEQKEQGTPSFPAAQPLTEAALAELRAAKRLAIAARFSGRAPFLTLEELAVTAGATVYQATALDGLRTELLDILEAAPEVVLFGLKAYLHAGLTFAGKIYDAELAAYLLHPEEASYSVPALYAEFFPEKGTAVPDEAEQTFAAAALYALREPLFAQLAARALDTLYREMELPLVPVLAAMEEAGVYVNRAHLAAKAEEVGARIEHLAAEIETLAGHPFNIKSTKQLGEVLFDELKLPPAKKTKTGYSTNAEVLEGLRGFHPIIEKILSYRVLTKLKSTYLDAIGGLISPESGRVHTSFHQTVTATGRLSSSDPNLQNIPVRTEEGREIRTLFEPGEGFDALLSADYSQIELRLLAHMSRDEDFIAAFRAGEDIHARTAAEVFHVPLADVTPEERRHAKAVNFGIVYGISDFGLARDLHISRKEAAAYIEEYFTRYPGVKKFLDRVVAEAHETGEVKTLYGRRRALPGIRSRSYNQRALAERMAMNTPIQGTAADIIKLAMIRAARGLKEAGVKSRILLQVHDELVLEVKNEEIPQVTAILKDAMENVAEFSVPLLIDVNVGKNWAEAK